MADLPILADRLNDIEVSGNAPVTETLMRRIGSNINFLLDFLGVSDGSTVATGQLSDIIAAVNAVDGHTIIKQGTFAGGLTNTIGTYSKIKYVNRLFWSRNEASAGAAVKSPRALMKSVDGGANVLFTANPTTPTNTSATGGLVGNEGVITSDNLNIADIDTNHAIGGPGPYLRFFDAALGTVGYQHGMRDEEWTLIGRLNWRDGNSVAVREYHEPVSAELHCYMSYEFDLRSAPIIAP